MTLTQRPGQNLLDVALQHYGDVRGLMALVADNPGYSLTRPFAPAGTQHQVRPDRYSEPLANPRIALAYQRDGTQPASGNEQPCGIGWMIINDTFVVGTAGNPCAGDGSGPDDPNATSGSYSTAFGPSFDTP